MAPSIEALIAFRLIQGVAGALLLPQGLGLLRENLSGKELGIAFGIFGTRWAGLVGQDSSSVRVAHCNFPAWCWRYPGS